MIGRRWTISSWALALAVVAAATAPLLDRARARSEARDAGFPGWPAQHEGRALSPLPLSAREAAFVNDFPGRVGRFTDGHREIIVRWVGAPTRKLHPASDCLRAVGYAITPIAARTTAAGAPMGCFRAVKGEIAMTVCELVRDERGGHWPDASSWYWHALLARDGGPWWSLTVAEAE